MGESNATNEDLTTYCGLYCGACGIKNGRIRETATTLKQLLDMYAYPEWAPLVANGSRRRNTIQNSRPS